MFPVLADLAKTSAPNTVQFKDLCELPWDAAKFTGVIGVLHISRETLFGSVVVLLPLEFFALFNGSLTLPSHPDTQRSRHALTVAGVLDLITLVFLLGLVPDVKSWKCSEKGEAIELIVLLLLTTVASVVSSFYVIYQSQYLNVATENEQKKST
jgi:hypothetical protein